MAQNRNDQRFSPLMMALSTLILAVIVAVVLFAINKDGFQSETPDTESHQESH